MNKKIIALTVLAASAFGSMAHAADGTINFTGSVTANACTVSATSASQSVPMGSVAATAFKAAGDAVSPSAFSIVLSACPAAATKAAIKFDGFGNATNSSLLALTAGTGVATGVGIGIYESNGTTLIPVGTASASQTLVTTGNNTLNYVAKYVSTSTTIAAGTANAVSNFTVSYN